MTSRFGRNQKRKLQEQITALIERAVKQDREATMLRFQLENARTDALRDYAEKAGLLSDALSQIGANLGYRLGDKLLPHAQRLMAAAVNKERAPFLLHARVDYRNAKETVIEGEIPSLHYRMVIMK